MFKAFGIDGWLKRQKSAFKKNFTFLCFRKSLTIDVGSGESLKTCVAY